MRPTTVRPTVQAGRDQPARTGRAGDAHAVIAGDGMRRSPPEWRRPASAGGAGGTIDPGSVITTAVGTSTSPIQSRELNRPMAMARLGDRARGRCARSSLDDPVARSRTGGMRGVEQTLARTPGGTAAGRRGPRAGSRQQAEQGRLAGLPRKLRLVAHSTSPRHPVAVPVPDELGDRAHPSSSRPG